VLTGTRDIKQQQFSYAALSAENIDVVALCALDVDPVAHTIVLGNGEKLSYDRLIMSPGIDLNWQAMPGYSESAAQIFPHAWQAGAQTLLLRDQLQTLPKGGLVVMSVPKSPYRCPPGPYERASLMASYLKQANPRAKILILDAKDSFSKKSLFTSAWQEIYGDMIEWQGESDGATVVGVDVKNRLVDTDFERIKVDVANIIPPQKAAKIAELADVVDNSGWCPIHPATFESQRHADIHVIGDAAIANAMPKSAFAANAQAKLCAFQVTRMLKNQPPVSGKLINTCYSLVAPDYGISVAGVYQPTEKIWAEIEGAGGTSPATASAQTRALEATYAHRWFNNITAQVFG
jgi:NADPH-dependent 2,4-dienoyl-CoA reductase/sulfur reductase-like enzyme